MYGIFLNIDEAYRSLETLQMALQKKTEKRDKKHDKNRKRIYQCTSLTHFYFLLFSNIEILNYGHILSVKVWRLGT